MVIYRALALADSGQHNVSTGRSDSVAPILSLDPDKGAGVFWVQPVVLGITYGVLHVLGPDHIGTLISLSISAKPQTAFALGATWSLGHCAGMALVGMLLFLLERFVEQKQDLEAWEHYGDYVVGASLVICGLYFLLNEVNYVEQNVDGSISLKACECHGPAEPQLAPHFSRPLSQSRRKKKVALCARYTKTACDHDASDDGSTTCCSSSSEVCGVPSRGRRSTSLDDDTEGGGSGTDVDRQLLPVHPPVPPPRAVQSLESGPPEPPTLADRSMGNKPLATNFSGMMLGIVQGMCCPMGLVGITLLTSMQASRIAVFLVVFLFVSAIGTGAFSYCWSHLVRSNCIPGCSPMRMYEISAWFTSLLGVCWIAANYFGVLDKLNYAE